MIIFKEVRWGNAFSYGPNNRVQLNASPLTQLVGKNGHGKSSIALIIEEALFNTNSKKIKKADVLNRYTKDRAYTIELDFEKDGNNYTVSTKRTTTSGTVTLTCNGEDISSHTATGTYKQIEYILGYDHKTFSQIVYQSSVASLEFLTATDTARKKFLIELLNLSHYTKASEVFKELASTASKNIEVSQGKVNTVSAWLKKYEKEDLTLVPSVPEPDPATEQAAKIVSLKESLKTIESTNKKISQNNQYKDIVDKLEITSWSSPIPDRKSGYNDWQVQLLALKKELKEGKTLASKCTGPTTKCPTCSQDVDNSRMFTMAQEFESKKPDLETQIASLEEKINLFEAMEKAYKVHTDDVAEWEKYHALYDPNMPTEQLDRKEIEAEIKELQEVVDTQDKAIEIAKKHNKSASEKNAKIEVILAQMDDMKAELVQHSATLVKETEALADLQILVKAFSTTGLVAYKIECLVKDLEEITNKYLTILADGRFQLSFKIASSDKLNVVIVDNGREISIDALSSGERARVNVASLLGIRSLMQSLSNSRTNLLILDETVENLDAEGKEKLIEVLLAEDSLNTFLISHGFSHPLLEKLQIVKSSNISRIDNG